MEGFLSHSARLRLMPAHKSSVEAKVEQQSGSGPAPAVFTPCHHHVNLCGLGSSEHSSKPQYTDLDFPWY